VRSSVLIFNPKAGGQRAAARVTQLQRLLRQSGFETEAVATSGPGDATGLARRWAERAEIEAVFALGGDGTQREVAAGLLGSPVALCPLPGGTTNVLARALGLPLSPEKVAQRAAAFVRRPLDVGLCNGEPFLMMASWGLDAAVLAAQNPALKARLGRLGVLAPAVKAWWRYPYRPFQVEAAGQSFEASFVVAANIHLYGGAFRIAPQAQADSGRLEVVAFEGRGRGATLSFARDLALGRHLRRRDTRLLSAESVTIDGGTEAVAGQVDGDFAGYQSRWQVKLSHQRLEILAPPTRPDNHRRSQSS
jgi:diacylglycerol kinase family enzyme